MSDYESALRRGFCIVAILSCLMGMATGAGIAYLAMSGQQQADCHTDDECENGPSPASFVRV